MHIFKDIYIYIRVIYISQRHSDSYAYEYVLYRMFIYSARHGMFFTRACTYGDVYCAANSALLSVRRQVVSHIKYGHFP